MNRHLEYRTAIPGSNSSIDAGQSPQRASAPKATNSTMRIFVTGATGAIGRRVVPMLLEAGHQVTAVGRTAEKRGVLAKAGARPADTNLFDPASVRRSIEGAEVIINLATAVPAGLKAILPWTWGPMDRVRREVSANLVSASLAEGGVRRFIQESFAPIYAEAGDRWVSESDQLKPARYNRSVLTAEANAERLTQRGGESVILRFGYLYGPRDGNTQQLLDGIRRGWYPLFGEREGYSSWVSHHDAAAAVVAALGLPGGIYNVVEDRPLRRIELAEAVAQELGVPLPKFLPAWATRLSGSVAETLARSLRIANRKLKAASNWTPRFPSTADGLVAIISGRG